MEKNRERLIFIGIIILLILFALFREWRSGVAADNLVRDIKNYSDSATYYKLKNGAEVATNVSLKLQSEEQLRIMVSNNDTVKQMIKKFKDLKAVTYITNNFHAGKDTIRLTNIIPCDFPPFKVRRGDSTYKFVGTIAPKYFSVDSIDIPNKLTIVQGRKKMGFMKYDYAIDVTNSNPMMKTTNIADYRYVPQKKWYERQWFAAILGAGVGYIGANVQSYYIKH